MTPENGSARTVNFLFKDFAACVTLLRNEATSLNVPSYEKLSPISIASKRARKRLRNGGIGTSDLMFIMIFSSIFYPPMGLQYLYNLYKNVNQRKLSGEGF
jgi:hypothetical protein